MFQNKNKEFISVTSLFDGRGALVRASCIDAVVDNADEDVDYGHKPSCRRIFFSGTYIDVKESLEDICDMIRYSEL